MLVINNIEVTRADWESILSSIQMMQRNLREGNLENIEWTLDVLERHLSKNLREDLENENNI